MSRFSNTSLSKKNALQNTISALTWIYVSDFMGKQLLSEGKCTSELQKSFRFARVVSHIRKTPLKNNF